MQLLVSGATRTATKYSVGRLIVPEARNLPETLDLQPGRWAMDNGAFAGFKPGPFVTMLEQFYGQPGCLFVAAPDVVGDFAATVDRWPFWSRLIRGLGYPVAIVVQNGCSVDQLPPDADAVFIGGSLECAPCGYVRPITDRKRDRCPHCRLKLAEWKLGPTARTIAGYAKARGLWLHVGRVNSDTRVRRIAQFDADSYDGTSTSKYSEVHIPRRLRCHEEIRRQLGLSL